jgi:hypothetical protein
VAAVSLPPQVQSLVDQMIQALGMQACRPTAIRIAMDNDGVVQVVTPEISYRRQKFPDPKPGESLSEYRERNKEVLDRRGEQR